MSVESVPEQRLPPGWWIVPALAVSLVFWGTAIWLFVS
jgi:hypothetical protein